MAKDKASILYKDPVCGWVEISVNQEYEFKSGLIVPDKYLKRTEKISKILWAAYHKEKYAEWHESFDNHEIKRKHDVIQTPLHIEEKSKRIRFFYTICNGHAPHVEMRRQGLVTMIKIAHPRAEDSNVLHRTEIKIRQQKPGRLNYKLLLKNMPKGLKKPVATIFNKKSDPFAAVRGESCRYKITAPTIHVWKGRSYVIDYERARDPGTNLDMAGDQRDYNEFEGEVKGIYDYDEYIRSDNPEAAVDLKEMPEYAGLTRPDINELVESFLSKRLVSFHDWGNNCLELKGYKDCRIKPITHSKSQPDMEGLRSLFESVGKAMKGIVKRASRREGLFAVDPELRAARQAMKLAA